MTDKPINLETVVSVEQGDAGDAIDYALGHIKLPVEQVDFLEAWREGDLADFPAYVEWVCFQHRCAAESKAARPSQPPVMDVERVIERFAEELDKWGQLSRRDDPTEIAKLAAIAAIQSGRE